MQERVHTIPDQVPDAARPVLTIGADGVVRVDYGPCDRITLAAVRYVHDWRMANGPRHKIPALLVGGRVGSVDYQAQRFASSSEVCAATSAVAFVVQSFLERHLARLFLMYHHPPYPTRVFEDEAMARAWLRNYLETK